MDSKKDGYIHFILGPMFSGKSTRVINLVRRFKSIGTDVLIIKHKLDTRYNSGSVSISSHDSVMEDCISVNYLHEIHDNLSYKQLYEKASIIAIEEAQFFNDLVDFVVQASDFDKKYVIISGLSGDYKRKPFGSILNTIPLANEIEKLHAYCALCRDTTLADFTLRLNNNNDTILIGSKDSYLPVCRKHYNEHFLK